MAERYELIPFPNNTALAGAVAKRWVQKVGEASGRECSVALSGGRIARELCDAIARESKAQGVSLAQVHFFWADERCVPPDDPESNFLIAQTRLFAPLGLVGSRIHRIRGELNSGLAAAQAEAEMRQALLVENDLPVLDVVFLGLGEDGHTASLFPGEYEEAVRNPAVYRAVIATKPPPPRVTLGYGVLAAAREVWMLASGVGKEEALKNSLSDRSTTPFGRLLGMRKRTLIFSDIPLA
jgi:6-phosphogluconolactonase